MAILKANEIRELSLEEMQEKIVEMKKELMKEGVNKATGGSPSNPGKIQALKRTIARVLTIMKEKEAQNA
ncbi:large subunit ribosomal protein L29 [Methanococcus voltae]|uniref:50S ribosomal protein L29 n=1 Tax=Methanococcus voltae TaxID=2188 RepID=UPI001AE9E042|nr:50S ribosomal protein L29 [Methanococcus voltae]MBP2143017.1 large subunit ribosomal protein L29 [Methanococcus voltae]